MSTQATRAKAPSSRTRDPEVTRERLLECAFREIHEKGYGGASVDQILAHTGVTKGALYHHFGSKADLAVAVIDEVMLPFVLERWVEPVRRSDDPVTALVELSHANLWAWSDRFVTCGCPLNNIAQELANEDERFRAHIHRVFDAWRGGLVEAFDRGQSHGNVRDDVDPESVAAFVVAAIEGLATTMKSTRDRDVTLAAASAFIQWLETLRPANVAA